MHNKNKIIISCIFTAVSVSLLALLTSGCGRSRGKETLALIGNTKITVSDFDERISNLPERYQAVVKKRKNEFLQKIINDTVLYQEAVREGLHKDKDVQKVIEEAKKKILIARLLKDRLDDSIEITDEEIIADYSQNRERYMTPEIMRVSHILVPTREEAENVLKQLDKGKSFEDMAKAKSVDPTAQRGGDIGYFPKGQLMPEFEAACTQLQIDQVSGVVETKLGYHIIKLTDRRPPVQPPLNEVKEKIKSRLHNIERQKLFNDLLKNLHEKTKIKVNEEVLKAGGEDENK